jgi:hypothetical protein
MRIWLTEYTSDGKTYAGPRIKSPTIEIAQKFLDRELPGSGAEVVGELIFDVDADDIEWENAIDYELIKSN